MIAQWIARALMNGQDHLVLSKAELAHWHLQGCRLRNGSPYGQWGGYCKRHLISMRRAAEARLRNLPLRHWPTGPYPVWDGKKGPKGVMPVVEATPVSDDRWLVPLIPSHPGHALDAWSFELALSEEEWEAITPLARALVGRCLLTPYCGNSYLKCPNPFPWDKGRLRLAELAALPPNALDLADALAHQPRYQSVERSIPWTLAMVWAWQETQVEQED